MIEEYLMNYGILGLWTLTLLAEKYRFQKKMETIIKANTDAINSLKGGIKK